MGYSMDYLLARPIVDFIHADDLEATIAAADRLSVDGIEIVSYENRFRCKDGNYKWLQWNVALQKEKALLICLAHDITTLKITQNDLAEINSHLTERVKELNCLYRISNLLSKNEIPLGVICHGILEHVIRSWQYPELVCARIYLYKDQVQTENFKETQWKQNAEIFADNVRIGVLEVFYLKEMPEEDIGPFLIEERYLINAISEMIGEFCGRMDIVAALSHSEEKNRILLKHTGEGFLIIQNGSVKYANALFAEMIEIQDADMLVGKNVADLFPVEGRDSFLKMYSEIEENQTKRKSFQGQLLSENGRQFWVEGHLSFVKWFNTDSIVATLRDIDEFRQRELSIQKEAATLRREYSKLKSLLRDRYRFGSILGKSQVMQEIYEQITEAGAMDSPVVITGETGTGKEEVARTIHNNSSRVNHGFVPVNCGAIPDLLFESEFFGYKKGAFTGAYVDKHGFFDLAHQGTFFLDEIGELSPGMQVKLLRSLESGEYTPVGCNTSKHANVRLISATNANLINQVREEKMREDFYYRINVIPIHLPPLRDRKDDIPLLADHFLQKFGGRGLDRQFSGKEMDLLCDYSWPGNIRELQNVVQRYMGTKNLDFFKAVIPNHRPDRKNELTASEGLDFRTAVQHYEKQIILDALRKNCWHKEKTAAMLGLSRRTFFRKLNHLGVAHK